MNYKKDKSYIKQRLEYVSPVDYIEELEENIEELEKRVKDLCKANLRIDVIHSMFLPEDTPLVVMTREDFDRQEQTAQDENIILKQRISKAINLLSKGEPNYKIMEILEGGDE